MLDHRWVLLCLATALLRVILSLVDMVICTCRDGTKPTDSCCEMEAGGKSITFPFQALTDLGPQFLMSPHHHLVTGCLPVYWTLKEMHAYLVLYEKDLYSVF